MKLRGHLEDPVQDGRIIWNTDPKGIWCGWGLRMETSIGLFWIWYWSIRFHKAWGISWPAEQLL